jgi:hypothetical protein
MVGDHYRDRWTEPKYYPIIQEPQYATREEIEALREEVLQMRQLLERALEYDRKNNEPECQLEEKIAMLKKVAEIVGVDLTDLIGK